MNDARPDIAMRIDPNTSDDVCTFCRHVERWEDNDITLGHPICAKGFNSYFRSLSNMGPIYVSDCESGELRPELLAVDTANGRQPSTSDNATPDRKETTCTVPKA